MKLTDQSNPYSKGGYIPGESTQTLKVRRVEDRTEYWEPELNRWVPILKASEFPTEWPDIPRNRNARQT